MAGLKRIHIGQLLLDNGIITREQLDNALQSQKASGDRLGQTLVYLGYIDEHKLLNLLAQQLGIELVDVKNYPFDPDIVHLLPEMVARRYRAIVLAMNDDGVTVGMADPQDLVATDELVRILGKPVKPALVAEDDLLNAIDHVYRRTGEITTLAEELSAELKTDDYDLSHLAEGTTETDAPVLKLLQSIFADAVQAGASDIHIEPDEKVLRIRQRIDGVLHEHVLNKTGVASALALRLKLMGGLNITEKRLPQDGRFSIRVHDKNFDVRLSTLPVQFGESVVMRLLNQSPDIVNIDRLGFPELLKQKLLQILNEPNGILLVTGPTGSGKTTTLYSLINHINHPDIKIITVEDPVEYRLPRISQVQVDPKIDLDFARVLRAVLRQDPDVVLIGELRDHETESIALRAAMTGHLVFTTLHTNDAASSVVRLLDMGAEGYIIASVLRAVLAQRLVRRICQNCTTEYTLTQSEKVWLAAVTPELAQSDFKFLRGKGCAYCHDTGYRGQIGVFELLVLSPEMSDALRMENTTEFMHLVHTDENFESLAKAGIDMVQAGITTVEEVMRIAGNVLDEIISQMTVSANADI